MHLRIRTREHATHTPDCRVCLDSGKVPYIDNHFDLWMVPCPSCPAPGATHSFGRRQ